MKVVIIIPARLSSTRLKEKLLIDIGGKPVIQHVYDNLKSCPDVSEIILAVDDELLSEQVAKFGASYKMTSKAHKSGTDRVAAVAKELDCELVINVQADEVFIQPEHIEKIISHFKENKSAQIATLYELGHDEHKFKDSNNVKLVTDKNGNAIYFSRATIPFPREAQPVAFKKHIGVYAFTRSVLLKIVEDEVSNLEAIERLEQLRWLENGFSIKAIEVEPGLLGIDTAKDLNEAKEKLK